MKIFQGLAFLPVKKHQLPRTGTLPHAIRELSPPDRSPPGDRFQVWRRSRVGIISKQATRSKLREYKILRKEKPTLNSCTTLSVVATKRPLGAVVYGVHLWLSGGPNKALRQATQWRNCASIFSHRQHSKVRDSSQLAPYSGRKPRGKSATRAESLALPAPYIHKTRHHEIKKEMTSTWRRFPPGR